MHTFSIFTYTASILIVCKVWQCIITIKEKKMQTTGHIQLKPTSTMFTSLEARAHHYELTINVMVRHLLALNLNNLDWRFYPVVRSMALVNKNIDTFEQCADHLGSYLEGAFSNIDKIDENKRAKMIYDEGVRYIRSRNDNFNLNFDVDNFSPSVTKFYKLLVKL